ncbi:type I methionyl aminopeptidase [Spiroplasma endosymbiont of Amphibalanus improvisus]|uniref:type I methionyl aminopeptidase n=1 Tax=Spiroplasma endosymbiont of Amphibalanus improvisus TaxID=3066327 RepID=UPI00313E0512
MITIKNDSEIDKMRKAGKVLSEILNTLKDNIKVGMTGENLDKICEKIISENNCSSNFKGYYGFPSTICVSVNENLIHGIPNSIAFKEGDLVSVDAGCIFEGYHADAAFTKVVGSYKEPIHKELVETTEESLEKAIKILKPGVRIGTIGSVIQTFVESKGFKLPTSYAGHGIGQNMHEDPIIPNVGKKDTGFKLKENMVICIEPMVQIGTDKTIVLNDGWTVMSNNKLGTAHFEKTILITKNGFEILTK